MSGIDPERWRQIRRWVGELAELDPATRATRLAELPPELADEVRALLAADESALSHRLEAAVGRGAAAWLAERDAQRAAGPAPEGAEAELAGTVLGAWRLERPLGRGGMAEVWAASRADGLYQHQAAVKLVKRGMDSEEIVARFRRERQILARLEHPAIARLLDGGVAPDGRPYFVLEKVDGEPITTWCERTRAGLTDRIRLLVEVCEAVAVAHRQLIVHRDLKPSNILVGADGRVKLLDFGIAKLLDDTAEGAGATRTEVRVLTPAYAAPEQIRGEPVSTATDVYALGVLGYELLTGRQPHRRSAFGADALALALEGESLERPSTAVLDAAAAGVLGGEDDVRARRRLARQLAGDLDTIVLSALRREPERRYGSVDAFAEDLRRFLDGRPITARRDSLAYRARKFVRRHRLGVGAAALLALALVGGLAAVTWQADLARRNAARAEDNARRAERVKEFLIGLFEVADPEQSGGGAVTAAELLEQAGRRLPHELAAEPAIQAELLESVARIEKGLGRFEPAARLAGDALALRATLPGGAAGRGSALATLGAVLLAQGKLDEAEPRLREGLALLRASEGPDSLAVARTQSDLAAVAFWREDLDDAEAGERAAWETYRRVLGDQHVLTAIHLRNLGVIAYQRNELDEAERAQRAALAVLERQLGTDHANVAQSYANLAAVLDSRGRPEESGPLYRRALEIRRRQLGDTHPATGQSLQLLGIHLIAERQWDEAEGVHREALELFGAIDPRHFEVGKLLHGMAQIAAGRGQAAEAERYYAEAIPILRETLGEDHPLVGVAAMNLARQIGRQGRFAEAEELLRDTHAKLLARLGPEAEYVADAEARLGEVLRARGELGEALALHRHSLAALTAIYGERHLKIADAHYQLAADLAAAGEPAADEARAALALYRELDPENERLREVERWAEAGAPTSP